MIQYYKNRLCLNCLAGSEQNGKEIAEAMEGSVLIGVLSGNYPDVSAACAGMETYSAACGGRVSVGLGGGNPAQWKAVAEISSRFQAAHINQVFSAVGYTRAKALGDVHINALVSPSGTPGLVKISTGPLSKDQPDALIPTETAVGMVKEMGGNALKFFPMKGLSCRAEYVELAKICGKEDFILEPTGGITPENLEEILDIALNAGVKQIIPHIYSAIVDPDTGMTKIDEVEKIRKIFERLI